MLALALICTQGLLGIFRVDYHAVALPGDLTIKGKIVRMGGQFSTAEASIFDAQGKLLASGRGTYFTAPPPPPKAS